MKKATDRIQRIVRALLNDRATNLIIIDDEPSVEVKKRLQDGRRPSVAVRDFLRDYAEDVYETRANPDGRYKVDVLYVMLPTVVERGVRREMYVKFVLFADAEDDSCSQLTIVRFHESIGSQPITRFPMPKR